MSVWLPLASIASTSNGARPAGREATNPAGPSLQGVVAGTVTWNDPTMTW